MYRHARCHTNPCMFYMLHTHFLPGIHVDIHTHRYTQTCHIHRLTHHTHNYTFSHTLTHQLFAHPLKLSHTPVPFTLTHQDADTNIQAQKSWLGVTQPPFPCPEWQTSVLSGAHTHAKLAGRVTDWQELPPRRSGRDLPGEGRAVSQPPNLG